MRYVTGARPFLWKKVKVPITNSLNTTTTLIVQIGGYIIFVTNNLNENCVTIVKIE